MRLFTKRDQEPDTVTPETQKLRLRLVGPLEAETVMASFTEEETPEVVLCPDCGEAVTADGCTCEKEPVSAALFDESKHPRVRSGQRGGGRFTVKGNAAGRFEVVDQDTGKKVVEATDEQSAEWIAEEKNAGTLSPESEMRLRGLDRLPDDEVTPGVPSRPGMSEKPERLMDSIAYTLAIMPVAKDATDRYTIDTHRLLRKKYGMNSDIYVRGDTPDDVASSASYADPEMDALIAAIPVNPPSDWFFMDEPDDPTPMTVTDEGLVYGHAAIWGTCHLGNPRGAGVCVQPPVSRTDYGLFHLGELQAAGGEKVSVGQITLDTGHAPVNGASARTAAAHYDDTGTSVADVRATNGELGIWYSGALRPDVTAEQVRKMRAAKISGDWRGGELVGMLCVNVPGFPVPRTQARIVASADGSEEVMALVAAGIVGTQRSDRDMQIEVAVLAARAEGGIDGLAELAAS